MTAEHFEHDHDRAWAAEKQHIKRAGWPTFVDDPRRFATASATRMTALRVQQGLVLRTTDMHFGPESE